MGRSNRQSALQPASGSGGTPIHAPTATVPAMAGPRHRGRRSSRRSRRPGGPTAGRHHKVGTESPPFRVTEYIVRIEWQKRGYPHAHILLWWQPHRSEKIPVAEKAEDVSWSDEEACSHYLPQTAEELSDKYICTKSPVSWGKSTTTQAWERDVNAKLAEMVVHTCNSYCGKYALGACRFGFPHAPEPCARRRDA